EAAEAPDDPAAEGDERRAALDTCLEEAIVHQREPGEALVLLAIGNLDDHGIEARAAQRRDHRLAIERTDSFAGEQCAAPGMSQRRQSLSHACEDTRADHHRAGPAPQLAHAPSRAHAAPPGDSPSSLRTRSATSSGDKPSVSTACVASA